MSFVNSIEIIDIAYRRGDTKPLQFSAFDVNGEADITGFTFLMTVNTEKNPTDDTNEVFQMIGEIVQVNPGILEFPPAPGDTDIAIQTYYYDIQVTDDQSKIHTPVTGKFKITQDITKD